MHMGRGWGIHAHGARLSTSQPTWAAHPQPYSPHLVDNQVQIDPQELATDGHVAQDGHLSHKHASK